MGGGPRKTTDVSKGAPRNPLAVVASGDVEVGDGGAYSYCQLEHVFQFRINPGSVVAQGASARLVPGHPTQIAVGSTTVGELDLRHTYDMTGCMEAGYRMVGWIENVDPNGKTGTVIVRGDPRR